jgi:transcription elongation factor SPT6
LDDLELEEWAVQKEQKEKLRNYIKVVNFMKNELTNPFQHYYEKADEMSNKEIFYKVTQESPNTFKKYSIVTGPIMWIKDELLCIRISDAGLTGILHKREFEKERVNMKDEFTEGQVIKAYVKNIEALEDKRERKNDAKNINIFRVDLTLKPDWNSVLPEMIVVAKPEHWARAYKYEDYVHKVKSTFDLKEARY